MTFLNELLAAGVIPRPQFYEGTSRRVDMTSGTEAISTLIGVCGSLIFEILGADPLATQHSRVLRCPIGETLFVQVLQESVD